MVLISTNQNMTKDAQLSVALPVPDGKNDGDIVAFGTEGLIGHMLTKKVTQADYDSRYIDTPQGVAVGEASVELVGIHKVIWLNVTGALALGEAVFMLSNGTYSGTSASGAIRIGYSLTVQAGTGRARIALLGGNAAAA